jgi:hypothetical protein
MSQASRQALAILRDPTQFKWYVVPIFVIVLYIYANEMERKNWSVVLAGIAFWGMDLFNELWNSLILQFTDRAAFWTEPAGTAYLLLVGINIETTLMFSVLGIVVVKWLPKDKKMKVLGIPNRWFFAVTNSILCVFIEVLLNQAGALVWEYSIWNWPNVLLIILAGYLPFMVVSFWVYDMENINSKIAAVCVILGVDLSAIIAFGVILRWI